MTNKEEWEQYVASVRCGKTLWQMFMLQRLLGEGKTVLVVDKEHLEKWKEHNKDNLHFFLETILRWCD